MTGGHVSAQSRLGVDRTRGVCVCPVGKCPCLHQCPGYVGVLRCVCGPHVCMCARPAGCRHTAHVRVDMRFSQRHKQSQLGPHASLPGQRARWG